MISRDVRLRYGVLLGQLLACQAEIEVMRRVTVIEGDYESVDLIKDMRKASELMTQLIDAMEAVGDYSEMRVAEPLGVLERIKRVFSGE
jgi:hypothetical protein